MKFSLILSLLPLGIQAFAPAVRNSPAFTRSSTAVFAADAVTVAEALAISKKFGAQSKEAASAWDAGKIILFFKILYPVLIVSTPRSLPFAPLSFFYGPVEEMDAADNSAAYSADSTNTEEYKEKVKLLALLLEESQAKIQSIKSLTEEVKAVQIVDAPSAVSSVDPAVMKSVLKEAQEAEKKFGKDSTEAMVAWDIVEEVASSDRSGAIGGSIEDECLVEALEACEALEELNRAVKAVSK